MKFSDLVKKPEGEIVEASETSKPTEFHEVLSEIANIIQIDYRDYTGSRLSYNVRQLDFENWVGNLQREDMVNTKIDRKYLYTPDEFLESKIGKEVTKIVKDKNIQLPEGMTIRKLCAAVAKSRMI